MKTFLLIGWLIAYHHSASIFTELRDAKCKLIMNEICQESNIYMFYQLHLWDSNNVIFYGTNFNISFTQYIIS